jgi:hypothetical protein
MRKTIEDLYYGNLTPCDQQIVSGSNLDWAMEQAERCEEKLMAQLDGEKKNLLLNLVNAQNEISATLAEENFILGFRLGMRLVIESMDDDGFETDRYRKDR